mgnify:FL=1
MEVKEFVFYAIARLNFHRIEYEVYNAKTGSTYIRVHKDRIRISDHKGEHDDYNFIIRCDCENPGTIENKIAVSAENADYILDIIILKYKKQKRKYSKTVDLLMKRKLNTDDIKKLDIKELYRILKHNYKKDDPLTKFDCLNLIRADRNILLKYIDSLRKDGK